MEDKLDREQLRAAFDQLVAFQGSLDGIKNVLAQGVAQNELLASNASGTQKIEVVNRVPRAFLEVIKAQFAVMAEWMGPVHKMTESAGKDLNKRRATMDKTITRYEELMENLHEHGSSSRKSPSESDIIDAEITDAEIVIDERTKSKQRKKK